jgi:hypothetical protein
MSKHETLHSAVHAGHHILTHTEVGKRVAHNATARAVDVVKAAAPALIVAAPLFGWIAVAGALAYGVKSLLDD